MTAGLLGGLGFWFWLVPFQHTSAPDYDPYRSPAGFWRDKQYMLRIGPWRHDDGPVIALFGDESWMRRVMRILEKDEEVMGCENGHKEAVLEYLANRTFPWDKEDDGAAWRRAWLDWWQENQDRSLEEWIQEGFALHGFEISLPPTQDDWPKLLEILGAAAGPSLRGRSHIEMLYPGHLRYNAYRWLRDSGFDVIQYALKQRQARLSWVQMEGLIEYDKHDRDLFIPPPPGRLAFAPEPEWGMIGGYQPSRLPFFLRPLPQAVFTGVCALAFLFGRGLARSAGRRGAAAQQGTAFNPTGALPDG